MVCLGGGLGYTESSLGNISLNGLNQTMALGKMSFSCWQPTGCRVTPPSHFQILLLGRSQPQGPWAGAWKVRVGKRGPGDTKEWVRDPERLASGLGVGKAPSSGRTWTDRPLGGWLAREHPKACSLTRTLAPAPEAALGPEQGMQAMT